MESVTVDREYFTWLINQVKSPVKRLSYLGLFRLLYKKDFHWTVLNDDNRLDDGLDIRYMYIDTHDLDQEHLEVFYFMERPCSVLEVLISIARRMNDIMFTLNDSIDHTDNWFHELLRNLKLDRFEGRDLSPNDEQEVNDILEKWMNRTYDFYGNGGLFPLKKRPLKDQTKVEIWYQMMAYLAENHI